MAPRAILSNHVLSRTVNSKLSTIPFVIIACTFSDNFLKITVLGEKNSRINRFLPECIAFNQTLRHYLPEWISAQTTQIKTRGSSVSFAVQTLSFLCGKFSSARLEILPNLRYTGIFQMSTTVNLEIELTRPGVKLDEKMSICSSTLQHGDILPANSSLLEGVFVGVFNFISLRWRIALLKQQGLCELNEIAEILSIVNVKVFRLFIYLIVWKHGSPGRIAKEHKFKETKDITSTRDKGFLWTEAVFESEFCNLQIYLSLFVMSNRILN